MSNENFTKARLVGSRQIDGRYNYCTASLISIIIPAYNAKTTLERCVESALRQTYRNIEIIIVDDGSTDGTSSLADRISKTSPRVKVVHQDNQGLSCARNTGLNNSSGDFIFFLDSDDYIEDEEIEILYAEMEKRNTELVVGGLVYESPKGDRYKKINVGRALMDENTFWSHAYLDSPGNYVEYVVSWGKLFKRAAFSKERFDEGKLHEDEYIITRLVSNCKKIAFADVAGYIYVQNDASIIHNPSTRSCLDSAEALLMRTNHFVDRKWGELAWITLRASRRLLASASKERCSSRDRNRRERLIQEWSSALRRLRPINGGSARDRISSLIFIASPSLFLLLAGDGRQE